MLAPLATSACFLAKTLWLVKLALNNLGITGQGISLLSCGDRLFFDRDVKIEGGGSNFFPLQFDLEKVKNWG